ncbi:MAG: hypothetical protein LBK43_01895, partial [Treponema sp.]|nr:hypothetical protein [Treponema sp.]
VHNITFDDSTSTEMTFEGVKGHSLFLVKVNRSPNQVSAQETGHGYPLNTSQALTELPQGSVLAVPLLRESGRFAAGDKTITRYDHPGAQGFMRNPPPLPSLSPSREIQYRESSGFAALPMSTVGTTKKFWVQDKQGTWIEIPAILQAVSTHSKVWVARANYSTTNKPGENTLTQEQAQAMADQFDTIYQYEASLFGYEYGGGVPSTDSSYGGVDGDPAVHILVYDIGYDYTPTQTSGVFGFFWAKDWYDQQALDRTQWGVKTNHAELFYIDSFFANTYPKAIYSTLAHEFQHMIHFNEKYIKKQKSSQTWFDEMLSLLAEDMIAPKIEVPVTDTSHPVRNRIPTFLDNYNAAALTEWLSGDDALISYANVYAFGAYLARNYGGAKLIKAIMENTLTDIPSLSAGLASASPGMDFNRALSRYGEAFIYSGGHKLKGTVSFDTTISQTINDIEYTFTGFDLWTIPDAARGYPPIPQDYTGPLIWDAQYRFAMPGYSVIIQSLDAWQQVQTDRVTITFNKPSQQTIDLYIMIR